MEQQNMFDPYPIEGSDVSTWKNDLVFPATYGTSQRNPLDVQDEYLPTMQGPLQLSIGFSMNSAFDLPFFPPGAQESSGDMDLSDYALEADFINGLPEAFRNFEEASVRPAHQAQSLNISGVTNASSIPQQVNQPFDKTINGVAYASSSPEIIQPLGKNIDGAAHASLSPQVNQALNKNINGVARVSKGPQQISQHLDKNNHLPINGMQPFNTFQPADVQQHQFNTYQLNAHQPINTYQLKPTQTGIFHPAAPYDDITPSEATTPSSPVQPSSSRRGKTQAPAASFSAFPTDFGSNDPYPSSPVQNRKRKRAPNGQEIAQEGPFTTPTSASSSSSTSSPSLASSPAYAQTSDSDISAYDDDAPVSKKPRATRKSQASVNGKAKRKKSKVYAEDLRGRPELGVLPPRNIQLSAIEILSFFPRSLHHPDVVLRLIKHGWTRIELAKAQLHAVNLLNYDRMYDVDQRVQKQISEGGKLVCNLPKRQRWNTEDNFDLIPAYDDLTAAGWRTRHGMNSLRFPKKVNFKVVKLYDIARPVFQGGNVPQGADRLLFTECLAYAYNHPNENLTTADCDLLIKRHGWLAPGKLDGQHDTQALQHFKAAVPTPAETAEAEEYRKQTRANWQANKAKAEASS